MIVRLAFFIVFGIFMTSCNAYRSNFNCCPGKGMPCRSVSEIESMIVETSEGPDLFVGTGAPRLCYWQHKVASCSKSPIKKVWIEDSVDSEGNMICGHYIYFQGGTHANGL